MSQIESSHSGRKKHMCLLHAGIINAAPKTVATVRKKKTHCAAGGGSTMRCTAFCSAAKIRDIFAGGQKKTHRQELLRRRICVVRSQTPDAATQYCTNAMLGDFRIATSTCVHDKSKYEACSGPRKKNLPGVAAQCCIESSHSGQKKHK